jgi:anti-sigma factor RsiW
MSRQQNIEERLWEYIDGICSPEDRLFIDELIATNQEWKTKYQELLELQNLLSNQLQLDEPSMRFTQNIMEAISKHHITPAAKSYIDKKIIWGIAGFFICSIIGLLIAGIAQMEWPAATGTNTPWIDLSKLNKVNFSGFFNNTYTTVFMMINAVLGLVLLDMYLNRKKQALGNKEPGVH